MTLQHMLVIVQVQEVFAWVRRPCLATRLCWFWTCLTCGIADVAPGRRPAEVFPCRDGTGQDETARE